MARFARREGCDDFNGVIVNAIHGKIRQAAENEFSCVGFPAGASLLGKFCQHFDPTVERKSNPACSGRTVVCLNVIADVSEIAKSGIRPADGH